jgi:hypothetical protein
VTKFSSKQVASEARLGPVGIRASDTLWAGPGSSQHSRDISEKLAAPLTIRASNKRKAKSSIGPANKGWAAGLPSLNAHK